MQMSRLNPDCENVEKRKPRVSGCSSSHDPCLFPFLFALRGGEKKRKSMNRSDLVIEYPSYKNVRRQSSQKRDRVPCDMARQNLRK